MSLSPTTHNLKTPESAKFGICGLLQVVVGCVCGWWVVGGWLATPEYILEKDLAVVVWLGVAPLEWAELVLHHHLATLILSRVKVDIGFLTLLN